MLESLDLPFVQRGLAEVALLSVGAGLIGTWVVLRGLAFHSHAVGTAAFPGLVLAEGLGFAAALGALGAAAVFAVLVSVLARRRSDDRGSEVALVLVGMLALGVILASDVFESSASIETLLFGSLFLIDGGELALAGVVSALALAATIVLGHHWLAHGFDAEGEGTPGSRLEPVAPGAGRTRDRRGGDGGRCAARHRAVRDPRRDDPALDVPHADLAGGDHRPLRRRGHGGRPPLGRAERPAGSGDRSPRGHRLRAVGRGRDRPPWRRRRGQAARALGRRRGRRLPDLRMRIRFGR